MRVLFDTNVLIYREDFKELPQPLQELLRILREYGHSQLIHPASIKDIKRDTNEERKRVTLSKLEGYPQLESAPEPTDDFLSSIGGSSSPNEEVDNSILFAVYRNMVDFLITEDLGIHKKAKKLGLEDRVLSVERALNYFNQLHSRNVPKHTLLEYKELGSLDLNDPFFDSLREDYKDFNKWFEEKSREGRRGFVYQPEGEGIKALLVLKEEKEGILTNPPLPDRRRLKICLLKVDLKGSKLGELFLKLAFQYCIENGIFETYLTHYTKGDDALVHLLKEYGFENKGKLPDGQDVYLKDFRVKEEDLKKGVSAIYPAYRDGKDVGKFLVPIRPEYHEKLFPEYRGRKQ
jgi:hypothetical protein